VTGPFTHEALPTRVVFGAGTSRERLAAEVERLEVHRVLVVCSERARPPAGELARPFSGRCAGYFTGVKPHVPLSVAEEARRTARELRADCLVSLGGGSAIGAAKAVALELGLPILAIPTTYSGSEMTPIYGLTEGGRKTTGRSLRVLPRVVVYDPELTVDLPPDVTGPSAINALAHGVEAFYAPGASPVNSLLAGESIRALARGAPAAVERPGDLEARSAALYRAYLAGAALASAGTGLHHKVCHVLGGAYDLPHAGTHSAVLSQVAAYFESERPEILRPVAEALGAKSAARGLYELAKRVGAPLALRELGMREHQVEEAVPRVLEAAPAENPRPVTQGGVREILAGAYRGRRPAL
jgi:maleylacetate reductase